MFAIAVGGSFDLAGWDKDGITQAAIATMVVDDADVDIRSARIKQPPKYIAFISNTGTITDIQTEGLDLEEVA